MNLDELEYEALDVLENMLEQELTTHQNWCVRSKRTFGEVKNLIYMMNGKDAYQHDLISTAIILRLKKRNRSWKKRLKN
jgi:hypothetical protein